MIEEMCLSVSRGEFVMVHYRRSPEAAGEALSVSWWEVAAPRHRLEVWMEGRKAQEQHSPTSHRTPSLTLPPPYAPPSLVSSSSSAIHRPLP